MILIKYEKARQTINLKTYYKEIENYITEDIEAMDTMDSHYQDEEGDFVVDELMMGIYEYREVQQQIKQMLKIPFDVLVVVEREKQKTNKGSIGRETPINNAFCSKCSAWRGQLGLEPTPELYIEHLRMVFAEVKRVLKKTGTCWVNIGDTYAGSGCGKNDYRNNNKRSASNPMLYCNKPSPQLNIDLPDKCMVMVPERFAFMMLDLGYILRNKIIWHKPNPMPSSVKDRFNTTYEMLYFFSKSQKYWFDLDAVREEHKGTGGGAGFGANALQQSKNKEAREHPSGKNPGDVMFYDSKYTTEHGQSLQGFIREQSLAKERQQSRIDAKALFPNDKKQQQAYINFIHDHAGHPLGSNPGDFWNINTQSFPDAHFAVFPEKLCEKPILAGCPAEVCKHCRMARVRITRNEEISIEEAMQNPAYLRASPNKDGRYYGEGTKDYKLSMAENPSEAKRRMLKAMRTKSETIGWTDCLCEDENKYEHGVILDPFGGSGTVSIEAEKLGRSSIYIDIKKDYCEMAIKRLKPLVEQTDLTGKQSTIQRIGF